MARLLDHAGLIPNIVNSVIKKTHKKSQTKTTYKIPTNRKIRRVKRNNSVQYLTMFSNNFAGLKGKMTSFTSELKNFNVAIFTGQETHYSNKGMVKVKDFETFEAIIPNKEKQGSIIGVHKSLKPVLIEEYCESFELIVVQISVANRSIRIITGKGPHENNPETERLPFFQALEQEVVQAELSGCSVMIEIDANSKLGPAFISHDKKQSPNGRILAGIINRQKLKVGNGLKQCKGTITRQRTTVNGEEESSIDVVIFSEELADFVEEIYIDTEGKHAMTKVTKTKPVVSDHNTIVTKLKLKWNTEIKQEKTSIFNLKNKECIKNFKEITTNNNNLSKILDEEKNLHKATSKLMKKFDKVLYKCFTKVGVKDKKTETKQEELYNKWKKLQNKTDNESLEQSKKIEDEISEQYFEKIKEATKDINCEDGGVNSGKLWKLKKELCPRTRDPPTAMLDTQGNLVTDEDKIAEMALEHYAKVLENRPMKEDLKHIKESKEELCEKLMNLAKKNKTPPWEMKHLENVLKQMKKGKSRDPDGYANEIFLLDSAGEDLKLAILKLMNRIKDEQVYPDCLRFCNISSIWKRKGPKNIFKSYRGIFRIQVFRSILDMLIYVDEYPNIDKNLTDCNVGARKNRNIRDNIFVLNAVMNSVKMKNEEALDCQIYDVETCFDALWLKEVINCLYQAGFNNDKLPLIFLENEIAHIAVKTSTRISKRRTILEILMQGTIWANICCVVLMDKLGKMAYNDHTLMYHYKGIVPCPPLEMIDDIMAFQECNNKSRKINAVVNTFMDLEKLTLSEKKCHKIHMGKINQSCPKLKVHGKDMAEVSHDKYLGDIVDCSATNKLNIEQRTGKGYGIVNQILAIVKEVPLGWRRIKAGLILRQAMLLNGILFNSETWHGIKDADIESFEKVDQFLLKGLAKQHPKGPTAALYLELGQAPIRFIWASRSILYLQTILKRNPTELTQKMYKAQATDPSKGDFCELVRKNMEILEIKLSNCEIEKMSKSKLKKIVKSKVKVAAFNYLIKMKGNKETGKMNKIEYKKLETQKYMISPFFSQEEASLLIRLRTRCVGGIRSDFGAMYVEKNCPVDTECNTLDTLYHVLQCSKLQDCIKDHMIATHKVSYTDVFSNNVKTQKQATTLFQLLLAERERILSLLAAPQASPPHSGHT